VAVVLWEYVWEMLIPNCTEILSWTSVKLPLRLVSFDQLEDTVLDRVPPVGNAYHAVSAVSESDFCVVDTSLSGHASSALATAGATIGIPNKMTSTLNDRAAHLSLLTCNPHLQDDTPKPLARGPRPPWQLHSSLDASHRGVG
jgi:hypothetical protein